MSDINTKIATLRSIINDALEDPSEFSVVAEYAAPLLSRVGVVLRMPGGAYWLKVFDTHEEREGFVKGFCHAKWTNVVCNDAHVWRWEDTPIVSMESLSDRGGVDAPDKAKTPNPLPAIRGEIAAQRASLRAICRELHSTDRHKHDPDDLAELGALHQVVRDDLRRLDILAATAIKAGWRDEWWWSDGPHA